jgi:hypothetical protein
MTARAKRAEVRALERFLDWIVASREELSNVTSLFPREAAWEAGMAQALYLMIDDGLREQVAARLDLARADLRRLEHGVRAVEPGDYPSPA